MTDQTPQTPRRVIHLDEIDPGVRERAFGDGLNADERFRAQMSRWVSPAQLDRLAAQMLSEMEKAVSAGQAIPILGPRGVVGWDAGNGGNLTVKQPAEDPAVAAADAKRARKQAKAAQSRQ